MNGFRFCTRCGSPLDEGAGYCRACGVLSGGAPPVEIKVSRPPAGKPAGGSAKTVLGIGCLCMFLILSWGFVSTLNSVMKYRASRGEDLGNRVVRGLASRDAAGAAGEFFALLKKNDFDEAYKMLDGEAQKLLDHEMFSQLMLGIKDKLGARRGQRLRSSSFRKYSVGGRSTVYYVLTFETSFDKGGAIEQVTLKKIDGILYVHFYDIKSELLVPGAPVAPAPPEGGGGGDDNEPPGGGGEPVQPQRSPTGPTLTI